ncbi:MAG: hypothetical protein AAFV53_11005 [Myxococcota bacterium]
MKKTTLTVLLMLTLVGFPLVSWALIPEAKAPPDDAFAALKTSALEHRLLFSGVESAPMRPLPFWVRYHPLRLWREMSGPPPTHIGTEADGATRYVLVDAEGDQITCEMQRRDGAVVWVWLDGPEEKARQIKAIRGQLRAAMPWVPVSCPWQ